MQRGSWAVTGPSHVEKQPVDSGPRLLLSGWLDRLGLTPLPLATLLGKSCGVTSPGFHILGVAPVCQQLTRWRQPEITDATRSCERAEPQAVVRASTGTLGHATVTLEAAALLRQAALGDPAAWEEIIRCYEGRVLAKIRTFVLQDADAFDVMQITWLRLAGNIHRLEHPQRLGGWLTTTAAQECLHLLHRAKRTQTLIDAVTDSLADPIANPEQHVVEAHTAQTLRALIAKLPSRRRRLLQALFTEHPATYVELSRATGIPPGSIAPTRRRALHQLHQMLVNHHRRPPDPASRRRPGHNQAGSME
jgi:RNA polymerase sigma factor (sigma-70 family)